MTETTVLRIERVGESVGVILPPEVLSRLHLQEGDTLQAVEGVAGELKLKALDTKHNRAMAIARQTFVDYAEVYRELAK